MVRWFIILGVLAGVPAGASAQYQPYQQPQPYSGQQVVYVQPQYQHVGLMLRLALGAGFTYAPFRRDFGTSDELALSGGGLVWDIALGGAIRPDLVLEGEFWGIGVVGPNVHNGRGVVTTGDDTLFTAGALGLGLTKWLMPINVYVSAAIGFALAAIEIGSAYGETDVGLGLHGMAGKEWWITPNWGIGVAVQLFYMTLPDGGDRLDVISIGVLFSATLQ